MASSRQAADASAQASGSATTTAVERPAFDEQLPVDRSTPSRAVFDAVRGWVEEMVPKAWREAAGRGGPAAVRHVRSREEYTSWYPCFGRSGLVAPTWPRRYGGLDLEPDVASAVEDELAPLNLGRLNPLGINLAAPALFGHGTDEQRLRFLPPILVNEERWCQLFSEPGAGSDLASLATRAERDGDHWRVTGQKIWTTWAGESEMAVLLARTDPDLPKRRGLTYFLLQMRQPGVEVRPLRHMGGKVEFNAVFLDGARVPDFQRLGREGDGWRVAGSTLAGERQMVSGAGSGGVDRIGGSSTSRLIGLARAASRSFGAGGDAETRRHRVVGLHVEERVRQLTNQRVRAGRRTGAEVGAASSIGKIHQGALNQRTQELASDLLGPGATAWEAAGVAYGSEMPHEVAGMLRSRANTIEGGTTEVNKNIVAERVLGLPREPDEWSGRPWRDIPRG